MAANVPAIDEASLPFVMPATVPRVKADGKPTTFLIDWEEGTRNWYLTNAVALDTRITEVRAEAGDALASYEEEINAIIGPDGSLVEKVETIEATAGNATANGQIYFAAKAGPAGSAAAYGLYLTAGDAYTGLEAIAKSDGTSTIGFTAGKFVFTDSGTAEQVFTYTGGKFALTGEVTVNGNLIVNGTVVTDKIQANAITNFGWDETTNDTTAASAVISCRDGDRLVVWVQITPTASNVNASDIDANFTVTATGMTSQTSGISKAVTLVANEGTVADPVWVNKYTAIATVAMFTWSVPSTGTKTIGVAARDGVSYRVFAQSFSK